MAVTNSDEINMLACVIASRHGVKTKVARVSDPDYFLNETNLSPKDIGINLLINPEQLCAEEFYRLLNIPEAREIVEFEEGKVQLVAFQVKPTNPLRGTPPHPPSRSRHPPPICGLLQLNATMVQQSCPKVATSLVKGMRYLSSVVVNQPRSCLSCRESH